MPPADAAAKIPCPSPQVLQAELDALALVLEPPEREDTWEKFEKALIRFAAVTRGGGYKHLDVYVRGVGPKGAGLRIADCMLSDRGRLSGVSTDLLQTFAPRLGNHFHPLVNLYLPPLVRLLARPNKVYLKRAEKCLQTIISHCPLPPIVSHLRHGLDDKSDTCKRACAVAIESATVEWNSRLWSEKDLDLLEVCMRKMATDRDAETRKAAKRVWARFQELWPERVEEFTQPLTPTIRRYLDLPAVGGQPSKPKARVAPAQRPTRSRPPPAGATTSLNSSQGSSSRGDTGGLTGGAQRTRTISRSEAPHHEPPTRAGRDPILTRSTRPGLLSHASSSSSLGTEGRTETGRHNVLSNPTRTGHYTASTSDFGPSSHAPTSSLGPPSRRLPAPARIIRQPRPEQDDASHGPSGHNSHSSGGRRPERTLGQAQRRQPADPTARAASTDNLKADRNRTRSVSPAVSPATTPVKSRTASTSISSGLSARPTQAVSPGRSARSVSPSPAPTVSPNGSGFSELNGALGLVKGRVSDFERRHESVGTPSPLRPSHSTQTLAVPTPGLPGLPAKPASRPVSPVNAPRRLSPSSPAATRTTPVAPVETTTRPSPVMQTPVPPRQTHHVRTPAVDSPSLSMLIGKRASGAHDLPYLMDLSMAESSSETPAAQRRAEAIPGSKLAETSTGTPRVASLIERFSASSSSTPVASVRRSPEGQAIPEPTETPKPDSISEQTPDSARRILPMPRRSPRPSPLSETDDPDRSSRSLKRKGSDLQLLSLDLEPEPDVEETPRRTPRFSQQLISFGDESFNLATPFRFGATRDMGTSENPGGVMEDLMGLGAWDMSAPTPRPERTDKQGRRVSTFFEYVRERPVPQQLSLLEEEADETIRLAPDEPHPTEASDDDAIHDDRCESGSIVDQRVPDHASAAGEPETVSHHAEPELQQQHTRTEHAEGDESPYFTDEALEEFDENMTEHLRHLNEELVSEAAGRSPHAAEGEESHSQKVEAQVTESCETVNDTEVVVNDEVQQIVELSVADDNKGVQEFEAYDGSHETELEHPTPTSTAPSLDEPIKETHFISRNPSDADAVLASTTPLREPSRTGTRTRDVATTTTATTLSSTPRATETTPLEPTATPSSTRALPARNSSGSQVSPRGLASSTSTTASASSPVRTEEAAPVTVDGPGSPNDHTESSTTRSLARVDAVVEDSHVDEAEPAAEQPHETGTAEVLAAPAKDQIASEPTKEVSEALNSSRSSRLNRSTSSQESAYASEATEPQLNDLGHKRSEPPVRRPGRLGAPSRPIRQVPTEKKHFRPVSRLDGDKVTQAPAHASSTKGTEAATHAPVPATKPVAAAKSGLTALGKGRAPRAVPTSQPAPPVVTSNTTASKDDDDASGDKAALAATRTVPGSHLTKPTAATAACAAATAASAKEGNAMRAAAAAEVKAASRPPSRAVSASGSRVASGGLSSGTLSKPTAARQAGAAFGSTAASRARAAEASLPPLKRQRIKLKAPMESFKPGRSGTNKSKASVLGSGASQRPAPTRGRRGTAAPTGTNAFPLPGPRLQISNNEQESDEAGKVQGQSKTPMPALLSVGGERPEIPPAPAMESQVSSSTGVTEHLKVAELADSPPQPRSLSPSGQSTPRATSASRKTSALSGAQSNKLDHNEGGDFLSVSPTGNVVQSTVKAVSPASSRSTSRSFRSDGSSASPATLSLPKLLNPVLTALNSADISVISSTVTETPSKSGKQNPSPDSPAVAHSRRLSTLSAKPSMSTTSENGSGLFVRGGRLRRQSGRGQGYVSGAKESTDDPSTVLEEEDEGAPGPRELERNSGTVSRHDVSTPQGKSAASLLAKLSVGGKGVPDLETRRRHVLRSRDDNSSESDCRE